MSEKKSFFDSIKQGIDKLSPKAEKLARNVNTDKYLLPQQAAARLRKEKIMSVVPEIPSNHRPADFKLRSALDRLDLDEDYLARFDVNELKQGNITLLGERHSVDWHNWQTDTESESWLLALHSMEYLVPLAAAVSQYGDDDAYQAIRNYLRSWIKANPVCEGIGWHPIAISRRMRNICVCVDLLGNTFTSDRSLKSAVSDSLYAQYIVLQQRCEVWEMGHRYFENLTAIVLGTLLFDDRDAKGKYLPMLLKEMVAQHLPDGTHYELSPMYHKLVMECTIRVAWWLKQIQSQNLIEVSGHLQCMCDAINSIEYGMGKTPFFNDSADNVAKDAQALIDVSVDLFGVWKNSRADILSDGGFCKLYDGDIALIFDGGRLSAENVTGHAHCDALSFELSISEVPLFVNSGRYRSDHEMHIYFRSTQAHNTAMVDDREQSEITETGEVARRISQDRLAITHNLADASYRSYQGDIHHRTIILRDGVLTVTDRFESRNGEVIKSFLHIAPGFTVEEYNGSFFVSDSEREICEIRPNDAACRIKDKGKPSVYSPRPGVAGRAVMLDFRWKNDGKEHGYEVIFK